MSSLSASASLLESINSYVFQCPSAHFLQWSDRHHELAELADEWTQCMPAPRKLSQVRLPLFRQACLSQSRNAMHHTASGSRPTVFMLKHARRPMCAACRTALQIRTKIVHRILCKLLTPRALNARNQGSASTVAHLMLCPN